MANGVGARVTGLSSRTDSGVVGDGVTRIARPTLIGTADPGAVVTLYLGDVALGTAKAMRSATGR